MTETDHLSHPPRQPAIEWIVTLRSGVVLCASIALAARFLVRLYSAPAMLYAPLIGVAPNWLSKGPEAAAG
jgi:hypothetical protein